MRQFLVPTILAGALCGLAGCKADSGSRASSEFGERVTPTASRQSSVQSSVQTSAIMPSQADTPPSRADDRPRPLVVCFGDSLTAGYGADDGQSYPDFLQRDLDRDGYRYRVVNEGISGNTSKDGVDRMAGVIAMKPDVVVLEFGGNDGLRGLEVQTTRTNLATMIAALQKSGAKVVLAGITLPPDYGQDYVNNFTRTYPILAQKYKLPILPFLLKDVYGVDGLMQADNVHATDKGNEVVARNVLPLVEAALKH